MILMSMGIYLSQRQRARGCIGCGGRTIILAVDNDNNCYGGVVTKQVAIMHMQHQHACTTLKCSAIRAEVTKPRRGCITKGLFGATTSGFCMRNNTKGMVQCFQVVIWATWWEGEVGN